MAAKKKTKKWPKGLRYYGDGRKDDPAKETADERLDRQIAENEAEHAALTAKLPPDLQKVLQAAFNSFAAGLVDVVIKMHEEGLSFEELDKKPTPVSRRPRKSGSKRSR